MTVCVAAMAEGGNVIFCGADRMLTKGDITYQPKDKGKMYTLGDKALVLLAGNMAVQAELAMAFGQHFGGDNTKTLEEYARTYADLYEKRETRIREQIVLGSRSLTLASYFANASQMPDAWSREIDQELSTFRLPDTHGVEAIFVGKDSTGPHIFTVENARVSCHDMIGYAVIGSGYNVADSQFVFARHSPNVTGPRAMYTLYRAKRMAEQSIGVGDETDWHVITDKVMVLHDDLTKLLGKLYKQERKQDEARFAEAEEQIKADLAKRAPPSTPPASLTSPASSVPQPPSGKSGSA